MVFAATCCSNCRWSLRSRRRNWLGLVWRGQLDNKKSLTLAFDVLSILMLLSIGVAFFFPIFHREIFDVFCFYTYPSDITETHCSLLRLVSFKGAGFILMTLWICGFLFRIYQENGIAGVCEFFLFYTGIFSFLFGVYHVFLRSLTIIPF